MDLSPRGYLEHYSTALTFDRRSSWTEHCNMQLTFDILFFIYLVCLYMCLQTVYYLSTIITIIVNNNFY